jgi:small subunit ribosomal protein S4e
MIKRHLKRLAAPRSWKIKRKGITFITRPKPGAHSFNEAISLNVIIKDILKYATTTREVKKIIANKDVIVDGLRRKDHRFMVGFMDTFSIPELKAYYRMLISKKGELVLIKIDDKETKIKLCRIKNKSLVRDKIQLNLFDSRNILVDKNTDYKIGDTLVIEVPSQKIMQHIILERGAVVFIRKGKKVGSIGRIDTIGNDSVTCKKENGDIIETKKDYVFVVGKDKPFIKLE